MSWGERFSARAWKEAEEAWLWPRSWLLAGRAPREHGRWQAMEHGRHGVLLVRGSDGALRAFRNACPHRGAQLCRESSTEKKLRCAYHGWTFDPTGRPLVGEAPLMPLAVRERAGLAWVCPSEAGEPWPEPIEALLAPLATWRVSADLSVPLACNWKLSVEVHLEGLHLPTLHAEIADRVDWAGARAEVLGDHGILRVPPKDPRIGANTLVQLFPNVQVNLHPTQALVFRHRPDPGDPERCVFDQLVLVPGEGAEPPHEEVSPEDPRIGPITAADLHMAERLAAGLRGGGPARPRWTPAERLVQAFHEAVERAVGQP